MPRSFKSWELVLHVRASLEVCARHLAANRDEELESIYLDAFLLHYRNLVFFLQPQDDVPPEAITAPGFAPGFVSAKAPTQYTDDIGKHLSRMTTAWLDKRRWPIATMLREMDEAWAEFEDAVAAANS